LQWNDQNLALANTTASDGVSPSPKVGPELAPPLNPPLQVTDNVLVRME